MYGIVFFGARLYGDAGLQLVIIVASVWGWYQWLHGADKEAAAVADSAPLVVTRLDRKGWIASLAGWALGFALLALFLDWFTDTDVPYIDGFLTAGSLLGTLLTARKNVENWHTWIVVDLIYVGLYIHKNLYLTALLYALFVAMAVLGLRTWSKAAREGAA
jgi:nicotinamide mononucleotide transporter